MHVVAPAQNPQGPLVGPVLEVRDHGHDAPSLHHPLGEAQRAREVGPLPRGRGPAVAHDPQRVVAPAPGGT